MVLPHPKRAFRNNKIINGLQHIPFRHPLPGLFPHKPPPRAPQILHSAPQPAKTATPMEAAYTQPSLRLTLLPTEIMTPVEAAYTKPNFASRHHYPTKPSPAEAPRTQPSVHSSKRNGYKQQRKTKNIHTAKYPFSPTQVCLFGTRRAPPRSPIYVCSKTQTSLQAVFRTA